MAQNKPDPKVVMIVDSNAAQLSLIEKLTSAEQPGCIFIRARSLEQAVNLLQAKPPHLVIFDTHLSDGTGMEILTAFPKAQRSYLCLAVTSEKSEAMVKQLFELGADDFLPKPIDDLIFQSKIRSLLSHQYMSPLSFLGRKEGLADIEFTTAIQLRRINEEQVVFQAAHPIAKGFNITLLFKELSLRATVQSSQRMDKINLFEITAHLDALTDATATELRRLIMDLTFR